MRADAKYNSVRVDTPPQLLMPRTDAPFLGAIVLYLRGGRASLELRTSVEQVLARHDRHLPLNVRSMTEQVKENVFLERFMSAVWERCWQSSRPRSRPSTSSAACCGRRVAQGLREIGLGSHSALRPTRAPHMVLDGWRRRRNRR